jgi:hypothetical protein
MTMSSRIGDDRWGWAAGAVVAQQRPRHRPDGGPRGDTLAAAIADMFQVSKQAALIRLGTLQVAQAS